MSAIAETAFDVPADDRLARRNAAVLAVGQALSGANNAVIASTGGILGVMLAPDKGLATLPISVMVVGMWLGTMPVGALARHLGRRSALQIACTLGVLSGLISCVAVLQGSFWLFLVGTFCAGLYAAGHQSYRFAACDTASPAFRPSAVSWVLAGGVVAGVLGPQLVIVTKDQWPPYLFAATYLAQAAVALVAAGVLALVRIPRPLAPSAANAGRPLSEIARMPRFIVAVACGVASFTMMNLIMTSAPVAMVGCGHSVTDATLGIQWHVVAMYAPSFVTGTVIMRFGLERVIFAGLVVDRAQCGHRHPRRERRSFLDRPGAARGRVEFRLHRRDHHGDPVPSPGGMHQGAGLQRLPRVRLDGDRLVFLRPGARHARLGGGQPAGVPVRPGRRPCCSAGSPCGSGCGRPEPATSWVAFTVASGRLFWLYGRHFRSGLPVLRPR